MKASQRIGIGFAVALLLVAVVGVISLSSTRGFVDANQRLARSYVLVRNTDLLLAHIVDAETAQRGYVIVGDTSYLQPYHGAEFSIRNELAILDSMTLTDPVQQQRVKDLKRLITARLALVDATMHARAAAGFDSAAAMIRTGRGKMVMDSIRTLTGNLQSVELMSLNQKRETTLSKAANAEKLIGFGAAFAFLLLLAASITIMREFGVRRGAETALRESQAQLTQFLDSLPLGAIVIDCDGRPTFGNTTGLSMFGAATLDDLSSQPHESMIPLWREKDHEAIPAAEDPMRAALRGLAAQREGLEIHTGETRIPIEISAAPVFDSNGNVAFAIATFSDITERQRARQAMQLARQAAEDSNRAKSDFLARMSHELRTPLNSVIGFANILLKNKAGNLREQDENYLTRILDNGKHLLVLINDILDLSKIESGKVQVEWEPVDLESLLTETVQQLETQAKPGVTLSADVPEGLERISSDPARLRQIAINLLGNALKFTQEGSVTISVEPLPGTMRPARIRVRDTGIGIPRDRLSAIFDAFEQADRTTSRQYGGTGLGLPISRALCELLGYTLTVNSEEGAGTEFAIDLLAEVKRRDTSEVHAGAVTQNVAI